MDKPGSAVATERWLAELADLGLRPTGELLGLFYAGAGTPGRLSLLDAAECGPTFGLEPGRAAAVLTGGSQAAAGAREGTPLASLVDLPVEVPTGPELPGRPRVADGELKTAIELRRQ